jgi:hypothetical protein
MQHMIRTEQYLARIWARTANNPNADWWDLFGRLTEISDVLELQHCHEGAALFRDAADSARDRCGYLVVAA